MEEWLFDYDMAMVTLMVFSNPIDASMRPIICVKIIQLFLTDEFSAACFAASMAIGVKMMVDEKYLNLSKIILADISL